MTLEWPAGVRAPFDGRTTSGTVAWGLAEKPAFEETNGTSRTKAFSDAAGKPGVTIVTSYGDIRVKAAVEANSAKTTDTDPGSRRGERTEAGVFVSAERDRGGRSGAYLGPEMERCAGPGCR